MNKLYTTAMLVSFMVAGSPGSAIGASGGTQAPRCYSPQPGILVCDTSGKGLASTKEKNDGFWPTKPGPHRGVANGGTR